MAPEGAQAWPSVIDASLAVWLVLTLISTVYVAFDARRSNPEMGVMKWGFVLVTLFMGPVGACIYILSCKPPVPRDHAAFVNPLWKQAIGSTVHCLAGDATGIIVAAAVTMSMGLVMWHDIVSEYALGFAFGLLVFQSIFARDMLGGSYVKALRASLYPEWISMNAVMAGMIPPMVILMSRNMASMHPASPRFWGVMSLSTIFGFIVAYPVNAWLVAVKLKHGMGTSNALGKGGHSPEMDMSMNAKMDHAENGDMPVLTTRAQRYAMAMLTLIALWSGLLIAGSFGDLTMNASATMAPMRSTMQIPSPTLNPQAHR